MSSTITQPPGSPQGAPRSATVSASLFPFHFVSGQSPPASPPSMYQFEDTRYKQTKLMEIQIENARKKSQGFLQKYEGLEYRADRLRATWKGFIRPEQLRLIPVVLCRSPVSVQRCPPVTIPTPTLTVTTTNLYKIETTPRILPHDAINVRLSPHYPISRWLLSLPNTRGLGQRPEMPLW